MRYRRGEGTGDPETDDESITIEIEPALHRAVHAAATARGLTARRFTEEALVEHLRREENRRDTDAVFRLSLPALQRAWDNEDDAAYDELD